MNNKIKSNIDVESKGFKSNKQEFFKLLDEYKIEENNIKLGGGSVKIQKQHDKGRMTARERVSHLVDDKFFEIGLYAGYGMYKDIGDINSGGLIAGIGKVDSRDCMIIANDATVKAGAYFEITLKKTLRAQRIGLENNLPIIYLVELASTNTKPPFLNP